MSGQKYEINKCQHCTVDHNSFTELRDQNQPHLLCVHVFKKNLQLDETLLSEFLKSLKYMILVLVLEVQYVQSLRTCTNDITSGNKHFKNGFQEVIKSFTNYNSFFLE